MNELVFSSARTMARIIGETEASSVELVAAHLKRIEEVNQKLNAVVRVAGETALAAARQADEALARHEARGVLHGVPMTIKHSLDTAGLTTTHGPGPSSAPEPQRRSSPPGCRWRRGPSGRTWRWQWPGISRLCPAVGSDHHCDAGRREPAVQPLPFEWSLFEGESRVG